MSEGPRRRAGGRWRAATLAAWLGIPGMASAGEPGDSARIQARFAEGQERFGEKRYLEAAEIFAEILGSVEEVVPNRVARESVMLNVLLAYEWAYRSSTDDEGHKDVALLDAGQVLLDGYREELSRAYGSEAAPSSEMAEAIAKYEEARRIAHETHGPSETEPPAGPCLSPPPPPPIAEAKGCGGDGGESVAWLPMLALPLVRRRRRSVERMADRLPPDVVRALRERADDDER